MTPGGATDLYVRAGLAGLASGMRTFTAPAALTGLTPRMPTQPVDRFLGRGLVRLGVGCAAAGEIVGDKLPQTPDRRAPAPFTGRVVIGSATGALLAMRFLGPGSDPEISRPVVIGCALVAAAAAATSTLVGPVYRAALSKRFGTDAVGATIEDLCALTLAALAARPVSPTGPS